MIFKHQIASSTNCSFNVQGLSLSTFIKPSKMPECRTVWHLATGAGMNKNVDAGNNPVPE
jgi:hypothetical protein